MSPGFVDTEIRRVDNQGRLRDHAPDRVSGWLRMPAAVAARTMVRGIGRRRPECIVTLHGKLAVLLARHTPWLVRALAGLYLRRRGSTDRA